MSTSNAKPTNLLTESRFSRERTQDAEDAIASLDDTVLRTPPVEPIDFTAHDATATAAAAPGYAESEPYEAPAHPASPAARRPYWLILGTAAALVVAIAGVALRAQSSRRSNVGLFGVGEASRTEDLEQADSSTGLNARDRSVETSDDTLVETTSQGDNAGDIFVWDWAPHQHTDADSGSAAGDAATSSDDGADSADSGSWPYNLDRTTEGDTGSSPWSLTSDDDSLRFESSPVSIEYDFGGGSEGTPGYTYDDGYITYYYGNGSVSFDLEELEGLYEQYLTTFSQDWGYGSGYGYGQGPGSPRHW